MCLYDLWPVTLCSVVSGNKCSICSQKTLGSNPVFLIYYLCDLGKIT